MTGSMQPLPGETALRSLGLDTTQPRPATSAVRFPDGGAWRIEIPSVEGVEPLCAVIEEAQALDVPVHLVSQGSGVMMLTDAEISEMLALTAEHSIELCLGAGPRARGRDQLGQSLEDLIRAAALGVRNALVADEGVLSLASSPPTSRNFWPMARGSGCCPVAWTCACMLTRRPFACSPTAASRCTWPRPPRRWTCTTSWPRPNRWADCSTPPADHGRPARRGRHPAG